MLILGIESTCDETGVAVVEDGVKIKSNFIASSVAKLAEYGGVVPEVVARDQVKFIIPLIEKSLDGIGADKIDAISVTSGPGLIGSLLIGVETAKALAVAWKKPLIPVNHLKGHIYSNWLQLESNSKFPKFPLVALIVSGGHTDLVLMRGHKDFKLLGSTLDDACGEAFDKVAKVLGLGYPGGPEIEKLAKKFSGDSSSIGKTQRKQLTVMFPRSMINSDNFNFSFSGIKTAVANLVNKQNFFSNSSSFINHGKEKIAFEFQEAVCEVLVSKTVRAAKTFGAKSIVVGGGVSANNRLRSQFSVHTSQLGIPIFFPPNFLSVDNGAMIAGAAFFEKYFTDPELINADPLLHF